MPPETLLELAKPVFHHRTAEFRQILAQVTADLQYVFQTEADVFVFAASGTGAMEASVMNLLAPGDKAIAVRGGKFGGRWGDLVERFGGRLIPIDPAWGDPPAPEAIGAALDQHPDVAAVYVTLCETSTAVATDVEAIGKIVADSSACLVVDGISSVGAVPLRADAWGVDMVVVGSQKALLLPPGLAFLSVSETAWERVERVPSRGYYFDLRAARKALESKGDTPYTPANTLVAALARSLARLREEGIEQVWARHHRLAEATRQAVAALGLELLASAPSDSVTAVTMPEGIDADALRKILKGKYGISVAGGQAHLKGRIIRIGHIGHVDALDTLGAIAALEMALAEMGVAVTLGAGVAAAQKVLMES
ncbi:MAG: pyridoxal-phosphate-dependent aminotransferase family protein [Planctomycetota bacterium]